MIRLERLGPRHAEQILAGQDPLLAEEIIGARWTAEGLGDFLARAARWSADGPLREYAAVEVDAPRTGERTGEGAAEGAVGDAASVRAAEIAPESAPRGLFGGGGITLLGPGLERGEASLTYWVLAAHRGHGLGGEIAAALVRAARDEPRIARLVLRIAPTNEASRAVARGLGARPSGRTERHPADAARSVERWLLEVRREASGR